MRALGWVVSSCLGGWGVEVPRPACRQHAHAGFETALTLVREMREITVVGAPLGFLPYLSLAASDAILANGDSR